MKVEKMEEMQDIKKTWQEIECFRLNVALKKVSQSALAVVLVICSFEPPAQ